MQGRRAIIPSIAVGAAIIVVLSFLGACSGGHQQAPSAEVSAPVPAPAGLLVEREISGEVLGQQLRNPRGLAVDRRGDLYLLDTDNSRLIRFDEQLSPDKEVGGYGGQGGQFDHPEYVVVENDLNLLVSDGGNRRICRFNARLEFVESTEFQNSDDPLGFGEPSGVNVTTYGEIWAADRTNNRIAVYDNSGRFNRFVGDFGYRGGQLQEPEKIVRLSRDDFLVCDAGNRRLVKYDQFGNYNGTLGQKQFDYPLAAAVSDPAQRGGFIWVLDGNNGSVSAMTKSGKVVFTGGPILTGTGRPLRNPADICLTRGGRLIIADSGNNRLLVCRVIFVGSGQPVGNAH